MLAAKGFRARRVFIFSLGYLPFSLLTMHAHGAELIVSCLSYFIFTYIPFPTYIAPQACSIELL